MNELKSLTCKDFLYKLSSHEPTPGGGAACALVGATAASLCCMVINVFSQHNDVKHGVLDLLLNDAKYYRDRLIKLMDEDAKAYQLLSNSYKLPKDNSEREDAIHENCEQAALVASNIASCCCNVLAIARRLQTYALGSVGLDADCAETMAISGFEGASGFVYGNLSHTGNDVLNEGLLTKMKRLEAQV